MTEVIGLGAARVAALAAIVYVRAITHGSTRPQRVTWGVWTLVSWLGLGSAFEGGAGFGAAAAVVRAATQLVVFLLSLSKKYGKPGGLTVRLPTGCCCNSSACSLAIL